MEYSKVASLPVDPAMDPEEARRKNAIDYSTHRIDGRETKNTKSSWKRNMQDDCSVDDMH